MRRTILLLLAIVLLGNGAFMLFAPEAWYHAIAAVPHTGPFNPHFVRDIGCAYLVSAVTLGYFAAAQRGRAAAVAGVAFLLLHGLIHVWDTVAGRASLPDFASDFVGVLLIPLVALYSVWSRDRSGRFVWIFGWLPKRVLDARIDAFERRYDYDMSYGREMLKRNRIAFYRFARATQLARCDVDVPKSAAFAAKLVTTLIEDCGPCTQLNVKMALEAGVGPDVIRAVIEGDEQGMDDDARLGWRFARATLARDVEADTLRDEIVKRWGAAAVISLAVSIAGTRLFPTVKYAMSFGHACQRVHVGRCQAHPFTKHPSPGVSV